MIPTRRAQWLIILTTLLIVACGPSGLIEIEKPGPMAHQPTYIPVPTYTPAPTPTPLPTNTPLLPTDTPTARPSPTASAYTEAQVLRVIDGDTIEVDIDGQAHKVRYIGIDCPEINRPLDGWEAFGPETTHKNTELVAGKMVRLEKDVSETDHYGRLLRYVWVGDTMINEILVKEGYAQSSSYPPDLKHQ